MSKRKVTRFPIYTVDWDMWMTFLHVWHGQPVGHVIVPRRKIMGTVNC